MNQDWVEIIKAHGFDAMIVNGQVFALNEWICPEDGTTGGTWERVYSIWHWLGY